MAVVECKYSPDWARGSLGFVKRADFELQVVCKDDREDWAS